jgi:type I thyroxine 5'-deiodinase
VLSSWSAPIDRWQAGDNIEDDVLVASTTTPAERRAAAGLCITKLGIKLPALIDNADNQVEQAYTGWPDRLYVIDQTGHIAYKSAAGPFGFKPSEVEESLKRLLPLTDVHHREIGKIRKKN